MGYRSSYHRSYRRRRPHAAAQRDDCQASFTYMSCTIPAERAGRVHHLPMTSSSAGSIDDEACLLAPTVRAARRATPCHRHHLHRTPAADAHSICVRQHPDPRIAPALCLLATGPRRRRPQWSPPGPAGLAEGVGSARHGTHEFPTIRLIASTHSESHPPPSPIVVPPRRRWPRWSSTPAGSGLPAAAPGPPDRHLLHRRQHYHLPALSDLLRGHDMLCAPRRPTTVPPTAAVGSDGSRRR